MQFVMNTGLLIGGEAVKCGMVWVQDTGMITQHFKYACHILFEERPNHSSLAGRDDSIELIRGDDL